MIANHAFIDGMPVPAELGRVQVAALFPQGAPALRDPDGGFALIDAEGGYTLRPGVAYTSISRDTAQQSPVHAGTRSSRQRTPNMAGSGTGRHMRKFSGASDNLIGGGVESVGYRDSPLAPSIGTVDIMNGGSLLSPAKTILDRIHEHIGLPRLIVDLIDTPEFQRLRTLKQLGNTHFLYPGATHTRFEHSIGVAHLAMYLARKLQLAQPSLGITDHDVLCVMAAGLCHDIGHGPFSHLFEDVMSRVFKQRGESRKWHHEAMSATLVRRMMQRLPLEQQYGLNDEDVEFVVLCIEGLSASAPWPANVGRPASKRFLCDIVANKVSGVDVDKLDYFMRDSQCCFGRSPVDCHIMRLLNATRVIDADGVPQICFEEKVAHNLGDIFALRAKLHKYAYQHRVCRVVDLMVTDAMLAAEPHFTVRGMDGVDRSLGDAVDRPESFVKLGDWILQAIDCSDSDDLRKAQAILRRVAGRELYKLVGEATFLRPGKSPGKAELEEQIAARLPGTADDRSAIRESIAVEFVWISYGSVDVNGMPDNPITHVKFFSPKVDPNVAFDLTTTSRNPLFSPSEFAEKSMLVISRDPAHASVVRGAFAAWKRDYASLLATTVPTFNSPSVQQGGRGGSVAVSPSMRPATTPRLTPAVPPLERRTPIQ